ncbi:lariat debranching enzyme, C-terminal domain-containing protein [Pyrenochaeta sp. MPI-SDFR-AT-0127]|nr:lariat debranching enzyme, C-terminal domain-containing protein [Pyrenochaeta sp. MPI-SDFR-AT-0127]
MSNLDFSETGRSELPIPSLKIAVEGCCHGSLEVIYNTLEKTCESRGWTVASLDFLIICGDFQAIRNERDLNCMSVPRRYRNIGDFHRYYSGERKAPVLTLVIGGNHEASNYLSELYYGGWLAPNIYYMGAVNVLRYGPLRIAGLSGIFNNADYRKPHHERLPYDRNEIRSVFHVRECDISKLLQLHFPVDIGISHDWPRRVEWFGDYQKLFTDRPSFLESAKMDHLGSAPAEQVMNLLRPKYWFSGHMHVKYSAVVQHKRHVVEDIFKDLALSDELLAQLPKSMFRASPKEKKSASKSIPPNIKNTVTHFLALDKPGLNREFLELLEVDSCSNDGNISTKPYMQRTPEGKFALHYDEEWLSILRSCDKAPFIENASADEELENLHWIETNISAKGLLKVPENFEKHAPIYDPEDKVDANEQPCEFPNVQTEEFCRMLQIQNEFSVVENGMEGDDYIVFE